MARQVSVFLENRPGRLEQVTATLQEAGVNIRAMTLSTSSAGWGILNLLVDQPEAGCRHLCAAGHSAVLREIVVVEMADRPGGLHEVLSLLAKAGLNVQNAYGTVLREGRTAILVIDVENVNHAADLLHAAGVRTLDSRQIYAI